MTATPGDRFVAAVAARDIDALQAVLAPEVDFRGLTPGRFWEGSTPAEVVEILLGHWFGPADRIEDVGAVESGPPVGEVHRVGYRFDLLNGSGPQVVEQQAYYKVGDGQITYLRVVCSGFQPRTT